MATATNFMTAMTVVMRQDTFEPKKQTGQSVPTKEEPEEEGASSTTAAEEDRTGAKGKTTTKKENKTKIIRVRDQAMYTFLHAVGAVVNRHLNQHKIKDQNPRKAMWAQFFNLVAMAPYGLCERFLAENCDPKYHAPIYAKLQHKADIDMGVINHIRGRIRDKKEWEKPIVWENLIERVKIHGFKS
jgi:hypothetical protein